MVFVAHIQVVVGLLAVVVRLLAVVVRLISVDHPSHSARLRPTLTDGSRLIETLDWIGQKTG